MTRLFTPLMILLFWACQSEPELTPLPLERSRFVAVLVDMHVMNSILQRYSGEIQDSLRVVYTEQVFDIHNIDQAQLDTMLGYMKKEPRVAEDLYKEVLDQMTLLGND